GASLGAPWTAASAEGHAALEPPPSSAYTFLPGSGVRAHIAAREPFRARRSLPPSLTMNDVLPGARTAQPSAEDADPQETQEWVESLDAVVHHTGRDRARFLVERVLDASRHHDAVPRGPLVSDYVNTVQPEQEPDYPGDEQMERRIRRINRWNAA